jgi:hypothetical protein
MSTTNPAHSVFTVTVNFKGTSYDVEIKPTLNGQPIEWIGDRVDQWNSAEKTHKIFSQTIVQMLDKTNVAADSLETLGVVTSVDGFSFDAQESKEATQEIWEEFIGYLQDPVSATAGRDPVAEEVLRTGPGVEIKSTRNVYLNLGPEEQKVVRLHLFQKKCYEHFASEKGVRLPDYIREYTSAEKACLAHLLYPLPLSQRLAPGKEASQIWLMQSEVERNEMASRVKGIREAIKQAARQPIEDESDFELELDSSEEEKVQADLHRQQKAAIIDSESEVEELLSSSEESVLQLSEISIGHEEEDAFLESGEGVNLSESSEFSISESESS